MAIVPVESVRTTGARAHHGDASAGDGDDGDGDGDSDGDGSTR
jgi:hypothetical protein